MNSQFRYWRTLVELKRDALYLEAYLIKSQRHDAALNIFLALTSCGAIAGWVVWQNLGLLWPTLIALSQAVTAIKPWIPFKARIDALASLSPEFSALVLTAEREWYDVASGSLSDRDIQTRYLDLREQREQLLIRRLGALRLPEDRKLAEQATQDAKRFFKTLYGD